MTQRDLDGKSAIVTGGASGIGLACVRELASRGALVTVADVDGDGAREIAGQLGGQAWAVDLSETDALESLRLDADILVNNAGIQTVAPIHEFDVERFRFMQRLMVESPFLLIRAVLPGMYARGWGRIVNISSAHGLRASPFKVAYVT
ncbi:MAG: SDR family NAD(P)-dependent oxidoreductase, partial [Microbacterium sp.]